MPTHSSVAAALTRAGSARCKRKWWLGWAASSRPSNPPPHPRHLCAPLNPLPCHLFQEGSVPRVHSARKHGLLPHQHARLVAGVVKRVCARRGWDMAAPACMRARRVGRVGYPATTQRHKRLALRLLSMLLATACRAGACTAACTHLQSSARRPTPEACSCAPPWHPPPAGAAERPSQPAQRCGPARRWRLHGVERSAHNMA